MSRSKIAVQVEEFATPIVEAMDMELVEVEYVKEGVQWYLRVYIDKPGGVDLDDCQAVSEKLDKILDEKDPIPNSYILEVSSPGIERPLKKDADFERFSGRLISVNTYAPVNGKKNFTGKLLGLSQSGVKVEVDGEQVDIPKDKIASAKLAVEF
ncbi:ribosome maturation factor RimP [Desulfohalotomaculum tongense]|uniref:ribosome maturation factor RimP n=1 Tax=Desulforadius tongensis TaxID=1216062 RepID=UPI00195902FC|nr:ribosome maturation factor RimP [Desulforadius tongensis]MBM7854435.1 ribosome maturation factor RimP [Desulforadius tongensis]